MQLLQFICGKRNSTVPDYITSHWRHHKNAPQGKTIYLQQSAKCLSVIMNKIKDMINLHLCYNIFNLANNF
jgi:hypothetical protein